MSNLLALLKLPLLDFFTYKHMLHLPNSPDIVQCSLIFPIVHFFYNSKGEKGHIAMNYIYV